MLQNHSRRSSDAAFGQSEHAIQHHHDQHDIVLSAAEELRKKQLKRMGLLTGLAIAIHNFPEGLATFMAALADSRIGIGLAIAIGICLL
jgi:ZIP family zinc transporter